MNFTFKTTHPTGRYRAFDSDTHHIKLQRKEVGYIFPDPPHTIRLMIEKDEKHTDNNPNCSWMWIRLKKESVSLQEAKDYLKANFELITQTFKLHQSE